VAYLRCLELFNSGQYWLAHEALEGLWRRTEDLTRRMFYQGIIQLAAAFVHIERGNMAGGSSLLRKASDKLARCPSQYLGLQPQTLCASISRVIAATDVTATNWVFDWALKPRLCLEQAE